ncbi:hypothetical protein ACTFPQ_14840 [Bacillus cereus group sp. MYBK5-1]|uniref:hypothetical protein n=1 Tax=Bacillus cereus group sp. MYBK5-1 TaxID=3450623 RepID=UPI003F7A6341
MSNCKPIDELTIEDLKQNPIWEWTIDEKENEEHDETWVKPHRHQAKILEQPQNENFLILLVHTRLENSLQEFKPLK